MVVVYDDESVDLDAMKEALSSEQFEVEKVEESRPDDTYEAM